MEVFISWSGENSRSHKVALLLKDWLPRVIQRLPCFISPHDIEAGAKWSAELFDRLERCSLGILCLTRESLDRPWIAFEAAVLGKSDQARVYPLLIDLPKRDVGYPLAAFQLKTTSKEDMEILLAMINSTQGDGALNPEDLKEAFENRWQQFHKAYEALSATPEKEEEKKEESAEQKTADEILELVRGIANGRIVVHSKTDAVARHALAHVPQGVVRTDWTSLKRRARQLDAEFAEELVQVIERLPGLPAVVRLEDGRIKDASASNTVEVAMEMRRYLLEQTNRENSVLGSFVAESDGASYEDEVFTLYFPLRHKTIATALCANFYRKALTELLQGEYPVKEVRMRVTA